MIRPNYPNIYPNHHRIATRATGRCRLVTRENSRENGPQHRLIACQNQPAMRTLAATCSRISISEKYTLSVASVRASRYNAYDE